MRELLVPYPGHDIVEQLKLLVEVPVTGAKFSIDFKWNDTLEVIRLKIQQRTQLPVENQELSIDGRALASEDSVLASHMKCMERATVQLKVVNASEAVEGDFYSDKLPRITVTGRTMEKLSPESTVADLGLKGDCELLVVRHSTPTIKLRLTDRDATVTLDIAEGMSVGDLKTQIGTTQGIAHDSIRLVFSGRRLNIDSKLLSDHGIMDESTVTVTTLTPPSLPPLAGSTDKAASLSSLADQTGGVSLDVKSNCTLTRPFAKARYLIPISGLALFLIYGCVQKVILATSSSAKAGYGHG